MAKWLKKKDNTAPVEEGEMSFLDHLEELRWHIIKSLIAVILVIILCFVFKTQVETLIFWPTTGEFPAYKYLSILSVPEVTYQTIVMGETFFIHIKASLVIGIILAFPYIFYQLWSFIKPGLYEKEKRAGKFMMVICSSLFFIGVIFGYFVIFPFAYTFLMNYSFGELVQTTPALSSYVNYVALFTLPAGLLFQLPVVIYFLVRIGLVSTDTLKKYRKHAIIAILIVAAIATPPDVISQILIGIPLYFLYEISILIAVRTEKKYYPKD